MSGKTNGANGTGSALCSIDEFLAQEYDYVIVGGGTAGLCVAARLTENPDVKVAVLEAGSNRMDDKQISTPSLYPTLIGRKEYDWCMESIPQVTFFPPCRTNIFQTLLLTKIIQPNAANKTYSMPRGKVLGGSSAINYLSTYY